MKNLFRFIPVALCAILLFTSCRPDQDTIEEETKPQLLLDLLRADDHLNTFAAAIDQAGMASMLEGAGVYTVFAPTDEAFAAYLQAQGVSKLEDLPKEHLKNLVLNHLIRGEYRSAKLPEGYLTTQAELTLADDKFAVSLLLARRDGVMHINGAQMTVHADQEGVNGVIHEVDEVLALPNVANHMLNNVEFQSLLGALKISGIRNEYIARLTNGGPYTVLAPTNIAFATLFVELRVNSLAQIPTAQLDHMLRNLYFDGNVRTDEFSAGQVLKATNGTTVKVQKNATGLMFVDERGRQARVTIGDVQGTNGVIHAVDKVVLAK
jgi:uncharacterized surface protein with fasciclin (FAS1) repeats